MSALDELLDWVKNESARIVKLDTMEHFAGRPSKRADIYIRAKKELDEVRAQVIQWIPVSERYPETDEVDHKPKLLTQDFREFAVGKLSLWEGGTYEWTCDFAPTHWAEIPGA